MGLQTKYHYKIHDKLYDLTDFVKIHPGGIDIFNNLKSDTNITPMIYAYHKNPKNILMVLPKYEIPLNDTTIQYDTSYTYDKYCELKLLVYDEIHKKKIPLHWSNQEITYNIFMILLYLRIWTYCFCNANNLSYWWMVFLSIFSMGFGGLIFHEACHFAPFKNQKLNSLLSNIYPFANTEYWSYNHNYLHHSFTDTDYDCDLLIDKSDYVRYTNTKLKYNHRFQFIYMFFVFLIGGIISDTKFYFSLVNSYKCVVFFILYYFGICKTLLFFAVLGFHFSFTANLSHIHHECIQINKEKKNDFLYNQVSSSMNFRTDDLITRLLSFGLDIQIEHHLFPNIPHSSLRKIQHIVRDYCDKNDIPYIEKSNIFININSYICYLYKMGFQ